MYSKKSTVGWDKSDWNNNAAGVVILYGKGNRIMNCNIYNCGGIQVAGTFSIISGNYITDFPTDGSGLWANDNIFANNRVQNSRLVNNNHDDLFQSSVCSRNIILNNIFLAYNDANIDFVNHAVQGFGCFDGWYTDYLIKGNTILNDHPIGLWLMGAKNCIIDGNTIQTLSYNWNPHRSTCLLLGPKKSGELSINNVVINNIAPHFELQVDDGSKYKNNYSSDIKKFIN